MPSVPEIDDLGRWRRIRAAPEPERSLAVRLSGLVFQPSDRESVAALTREPVDWMQVVDAARALRAVPLVDSGVASLVEAPWIPAFARKTLWVEGEAWRRWTRSLLEEGDRVLSALAREGFRAVPIKGLDYARRLYPDSGLRPMVDLDLLLPPGDLGAASDFLKARMDYRGGPVPEEERHASVYHKRVLVKGEGAARRCLDLHSVFYHPELYPVDYGDLWRRIGPGKGLAAEDCLCLSGLTLAKDRYQTDIRDFLDIQGILAGWKPDPSTVLERARSWGATVALFYSLSAARAILGAQVSRELLDGLRPGWIRRSWLDRFLASDRFPVYRFGHGSLLPKMLIRLPLADSVNGWARFLATRVRET